MVPDDLENLLACFHMTHSTRQYHKRDQYGACIRAVADAAKDVNAAFIDMLLRVVEHTHVLPLLKHRQRLLRLFDFYRSTIHLDGEITECGVFRGVSTLMICQFWLTQESDFDGTGYHVFDSFQGLGEIEEEDIEGAEGAAKLNMMFAGNFACSIEEFRRSVEEFPGIAIYQGWIPSRFNEVADRRFRFVHVGRRHRQKRRKLAGRAAGNRALCVRGWRRARGDGDRPNRANQALGVGAAYARRPQGRSG